MKLPVVLQSEAAECGLACLAMIAGYHGGESEITTLRRTLSISLKGVTLKDLIAMAGRMGFAARPVRVDLDELRLLAAPCVLHWDLNHFVVLKSVGERGVTIHDPAVGARTLPMSAVSKHFTGVALELTPAPGFEPAEPAPRLRVRSVLGRMAGLRRSLGHLLLLALGIEIFTALTPLFLQWVVDHVLVAGDRDLLLTLALGFGLILLLRTAVFAMRGSVMLAIGASLEVQGRANLFTHLVRLPTAYFEARHLGDIMSRFQSQDTILDAVTTDVVEAVLDGLLVVVSLTIMFLFAPALAAIVLGGAIAYGVLRWLSYAPLRNASAEEIVWAARRDSHFLETLRGIRAIKLFNAQETRRTHWLNLVVQTVNRHLATDRLKLTVRTAHIFLLGGLVILVVALGAQRVLDNLMTVGMLLAFLAYKDQFLTRVSNLIDKGVELAMLRLHAQRLADIALTAPERPEAPGTDEAGSGPPVSLEVRNLRFRYSEHEPWVIDGLSFRVEAGETVAIVGASGCGKTTLLKVLASLLPYADGEFLVDGKPLAQLGPRRWRSMIGVVMQDDQLFAGSIADNICFFADRPDMARIEECARLAAVHDEIAAMPMGYSTLVGDMGTVLSGGQKQRVLIARALYRRPRVLLLDEATSHLDVMNEKSVNAALAACGATRVVVAHRPETVRATDRIFNLGEKGGPPPAAPVEEKRPLEVAG